jgi:hypothetical protein
MNKQRESTIPSNIYASKTADHQIPFPLSVSLEPHGGGGGRTLDPMDATPANRKTKKQGEK